MKKTVVVVAACAVLILGGYLAYRFTRPKPVASPASAGSTAGAASQSPQADQPVGGPVTTAAGSSGTAPAGAAERARVPVRWLNIAASALGGRVESVTSVAVEPGATWSAAKLIDGGEADPSCTPLCTWTSKDIATPQDIVISFYQQREALITRVVVDTLTPQTRSFPDDLPRQVEVSVSSTSPTDGFTVVAGVELPPAAAEHVIDFAPARARYVKVRILSSHGGKRVCVNEVGVFEPAGDEPSILADSPRNLALPALGGALVTFTSDYAHYVAHRIVDGDPAREWRSAPDGAFPQDFVFAFHDDEVALVDRLVLTTPMHGTNSPKVVSVSVSLQSPASGYEDIGRFTLKQDPGDQVIPVGRQARFLKVRILENFGGKINSNLGELQIIEGVAPGYESVLFRRSSSGLPLVEQGRPRPADEGDAALEREPNDQAAQANRLDLGSSVRGGINPIGEHDFFKTSVPGSGPSMLTVDLAGVPYVRTSISLIKATGETARRFDPAHVPAAETAFSWQVDPGDYTLDVTEPPASVVLIWDTSGSMMGRTDDLQRAVETYLDRLEPPERVNLIRFSYDIEVLLPEFSSDRAQLKKAAQGKFFADGHTPFYDAVAKAMGLLEDVAGNRAIMVMTDGEDSGSRLEQAEFWRRLQESGIRLYTIGLGEVNRYSSRLASSPRRLLAHVATATNGRAFFTANSAELVAFYDQIATELRTPGTYRLRVARAEANGTLQVTTAGERIATVAAPSEVELILDASGSMKRRIGGRMMIDTAKDVLTEIVQGLPDDMQVALRVYGHRIREGRPGACEDSELVFPLAKLDKPRVLARIRSVQALGTTPIDYSLRQVRRDVGQATGEKMIILVTDGKEECGGDPQAAVAELQSAGINVRLNIVGFALGDAALKADLRKLAERTSGQFVEAKDAASLRAAIEQALAVPYDVVEGTGATVASGVTGRGAITLPEGVYTVRLRGAEKPIEIANVRIAARETTTIELKKEGQEIGVRVATPKQP